MTRNRWASTRHRRNVCLRRFSIHMCDLDLWPHDLENLISWSPKCSMYSCKFCSNDDSIGSRRELSSSRDYHSAWSWPLTSWSENLSAQCHHIWRTFVPSFTENAQQSRHTKQRTEGRTTWRHYALRLLLLVEAQKLDYIVPQWPANLIPAAAYVYLQWPRYPITISFLKTICHQHSEENIWMFIHQLQLKTQINTNIKTKKTVHIAFLQKVAKQRSLLHRNHNDPEWYSAKTNAIKLIVSTEMLTDCQRSLHDRTE